MNRVHWVFFDLGCTLVDEEPAEAEYMQDVYQLLQEYGAHIDSIRYKAITRDVIANRVATGHRELARVLFQNYARKGRLQELLRKFDSKWPMERYTSLWTLYADAIPILQRISSRYSCGIIANQPESVRKMIEEQFSLTPYFKAIFLSGEVGYAKPDERIFLHALKKVSASPQNTVYVGDRIDADIAPANRLGMITIRVLRNSLFSRIEPRNEVERPSFEIKDLYSLPQILRDIEEVQV